MATMQESAVHHARPRTDDPREYHVRVRTKTYLWGSHSMHHDIKVKPTPILHIWNDTFGEPVKIGTTTANGHHRILGTLHPDQHFAIALHRISGVFAECHRESLVACSIDKR